jgi:dienelactone hydrolase
LCACAHRCAENDWALPSKERDELAVTLKQHPNAKVRDAVRTIQCVLIALTSRAQVRESDVVLYHGPHGFAMRADPSVSGELEHAVEQCFQDMVAFTKRVLNVK